MQENGFVSPLNALHFLRSSINLSFLFSLSPPLLLSIRSFYFGPAALFWPALSLRLCVCVCVWVWWTCSSCIIWGDKNSLACFALACVLTKAEGGLKNKSVCWASCYMYLTVRLSCSNSHREDHDICVGREKRGRNGLERWWRREMWCMRIEMMKMECHVFEGGQHLCV